MNETFITLNMKKQRAIKSMLTTKIVEVIEHCISSREISGGDACKTSREICEGIAYITTVAIKKKFPYLTSSTLVCSKYAAWQSISCFSNPVLKFYFRYTLTVLFAYFHHTFNSVRRNTARKIFCQFHC